MLNSSKHNCHKPIHDWVLDNPPTVDSFEFERLELSFVSSLYNNYGHFCFYIGALYVFIIFNLQKWMKSRPEYNLKTALFVWNLCFGIFSIIGSIRSTPTLLYILQRENGFYLSICVRKGFNQVNVFWGYLFLVSKIWEFGDTIFIVLRKKPLLFIHWYHHLATMVVSTIAAPFAEPVSRWFIAINYFVHSIMYPYFAIKTIGIHVPRILATSITMLQFFQMLLGLGLNIITFYLQRTGCYCARETNSLTAFFALYGSFVILFGVLLHQSFQKISIANSGKIKSN